MIFFSLCSTTLPQMWVQLWKLTEYSNKSQFSNQRTEKKSAENLENMKKTVNRKDLWKKIKKQAWLRIDWGLRGRAGGAMEGKRSEGGTGGWS